MTLYLLPNTLGPVENIHAFIPHTIDATMHKIDGLIAESEGEGRRYLKRFQTKKRAHEMPVALLNKHSKQSDLDFLLQPICQGENWGVVSDAGLPCLADPGAQLVYRAKQLAIPIQVFTGPSAISLSLMLSGLTGQQFFFHGYTPKKPDARAHALKQWEKMKGVTHIFIEAPYRNQHTFNTCLKVLQKQTLFCVASNLTLPDQMVHTAPIGDWKACEIGKKPAIFLFFSSR